MRCISVAFPCLYSDWLRHIELHHRLSTTFLQGDVLMRLSAIEQNITDTKTTFISFSIIHREPYILWILKNFSECIVKRGDWSEIFGLIFHLVYSMCRKIRFFEQLTISLSNEIGNPLWYNYGLKFKIS